MRSRTASFAIVTAALFASLLQPLAAYAESHNPADYPLRIHIFRRNETTFYHNRVAEEAKGEGKANLFENSAVKAVDFQFECDQKLQTSSGYETFPAKWKKPGQELVILLPEFGKPGFNTCRLKVLLKEDSAYLTRNGNLMMEPASTYKQWMTQHEYDPEHGKNMPLRIASDTAAPAQQSQGAQQPQTQPAAPAAPPQ
jgi:hypothetical protein